MGDTSKMVVFWAERIKALCMVFIGALIVWFAVDNYLKFSNSRIGIVYLRVPKILDWAYDTIGLVPSVLLQVIIGVGLAAYGMRKFMRTKRPE